MDEIDSLTPDGKENVMFGVDVIVKDRWNLYWVVFDPSCNASEDLLKTGGSQFSILFRPPSEIWSGEDFTVFETLLKRLISSLLQVL